MTSFSLVREVSLLTSLNGFYDGLDTTVSLYFPLSMKVYQYLNTIYTIHLTHSSLLDDCSRSHGALTSLEEKCSYENNNIASSTPDCCFERFFCCLQDILKLFTVKALEEGYRINHSVTRMEMTPLNQPCCLSRVFAC